MRFQILLCAVMAFFIGVLIVAYAAAKHANPILLDERGRPVAASH